jgi:hypothetical protein
VEIWQIVLIVVAADIAAIAAISLIRRRAPEGGFFRDSQVAAGAFTVTGTIFAVMVGFVFLIAFQSYAGARSSAQAEAGATGALFHTADPFPARAREGLQGELICYARAVVNDEWESMARDRPSALVSDWESRIETTFESVRPVGVSASNAQQNWFDETDARRSARRARLAEADPFVPSSIWVLLIIAGLAVISFALYFADRSERRDSQVLMVVAITTVVSASLLTIAFLDSAYGTHSGAITPKAMRGTLAALERERAVTYPDVVIPCNGQGNPVGASAARDRRIRG